MIRESTVHNRVQKAASCEKGFSLIELLTVVFIIGVMIGTATVAFFVVSRNTDVKTTAEMLKEDLRKVYAFAASGEKPNGIDYRYRYKVTFNNRIEDPKDCYLIQKGTPDAFGTYTYADMTPTKFNANKTEGNYIKPSNMGSTHINYGDYKTIYFVSAGSITMANITGNTAPGGDMVINIVGHSSSKSVTISGYGNISD
jgi:prepilin-type N-terminal cleavage/methylation domain-containing protein